MERVLIVGSGLAGLSATCELLEKGCNVTIIERMGNLGGNSSKATCGVAAPGSAMHEAAGVTDDGKDILFDKESEALVKNGTKDLEWLLKILSIQDELVLRLTPGHATARTIGSKEHMPGAVITFAVVHALQQVASVKPERVQIITQAEVTKLLTSGAKVCGLEYSKGGETSSLKGPVVMATGGYAGDNASGSLLARHCPELLKLPMTSDERSDGAGIKLSAAVGAACEKLNKVNLCPTAAIMPNDPDSDFKIVISDAISGAGGKLLNADGARFVDELASSAARVEAMGKSKAPFRLVIKEADAQPVKWLVDFYTKRSIMKRFDTVEALASEMRVPTAALTGLFGSSPLLVAKVTPALYSCAGGLLTGPEGTVLTARGAAIEGLFAAGEVCSAPSEKLWGVSGVPLLHAVFSGRAAGRAAASVALKGQEAQPQELQKLLLSTLTAPSPPDGDGKADTKKEEDKKPEDMTKDELIAKVKALQAGGAVAAAPAAPAGPPPITLEDVAKHNKQDDAWIVLFGDVIDVTKWIPIHPGGVQAIMAFVGADATEEWKMIHKPGTVEKNAQHLTMKGKIGAAGGAAPVAAAGGGGDAGGISLDEVAKHNKQEDAWVVLFGEAIDVTKWIPIHPGGVQAIMAYVGTDATDEWVMIHKPGTIEKNIQHLTKKGKVAGGGASKAAAAPAAVADEKPPPEGDGGIPGVIGAIIFVALNVVKTVLRTVLFTGNLKFTFDNNRNGTIRSAVFLLTFTIIHSLGNFSDMLGGPNEANGEGYLFDRIKWTGSFGVWKPCPYSLIEEYLALALVLHVSVALKRSYDISINYCLYTGRWNMLISGCIILFFLTQHLRDFRLYDGMKMVPLRPPPYMIAFDGILEGRLFWEKDESIKPVMVRDLYSREVELFKDTGVVLMYTASVVLFVTHMILGWKKLVPADAMQIPKGHVEKVKWLGWIMATAIGCMYLSVVWYVYFSTPEPVAQEI